MEDDECDAAKSPLHALLVTLLNAHFGTLSRAGARVVPWAPGAPTPFVPLSLPGAPLPPDSAAAEGDDDEAFARALQEQEAREFQARLLAMAGFVPGKSQTRKTTASLSTVTPQQSSTCQHEGIFRPAVLGAVSEGADGEDDEADDEVEGDGVDVDAMSYEVRFFCDVTPSSLC